MNLIPVGFIATQHAGGIRKGVRESTVSVRVGTKCELRIVPYTMEWNSGKIRLTIAFTKLETIPMLYIVRAGAVVLNLVAYISDHGMYSIERAHWQWSVFIETVSELLSWLVKMWVELLTQPTYTCD